MSTLPLPRNRKATRMTRHITVGPARCPRIAHLVRAAARKLSDRLYADADYRARTLGWTVTETSGWLGLSGRSYRDPRFAARRQDCRDVRAAGMNVLKDQPPKQNQQAHEAGREPALFEGEQHHA